MTGDAHEELAVNAAEIVQFNDLALALNENCDEALVQRRLVQFAVRAVPGAQHAAVTMITNGCQLRTTAASDPIPAEVDALQYQYGQGPCLQVLMDNDIAAAPDLTNDDQWPEFAAATVAKTPVRSMLSFRLFITDQDRAALTFYADRPGGFTEQSVATGSIFAAYSSMALIAARHAHTAHNLRQALQTNREIGVAMGILMANQHLSHDRAFAALRAASQNLNIKLFDIARDVAMTGQLPQPRERTRSKPSPHADSSASALVEPVA